MPTKVIVELSGDEERLLNSFRKAEAADAKLRADFQKTGTVIESSSKEIADSMIKASLQSQGAINKILAGLRETGSEGRKLASSLDGFMDDFGLSGKKSVQSVLAELAKFNPILAEVASIMQDEWKAKVDNKAWQDMLSSASSVSDEVKELSGLVDKELKKAAFDAAGGFEVIRQRVLELHPEMATAIAEMERLNKEASDSKAWQDMLSNASSVSDEVKELSGLVDKELKKAAFDAAGGFEVIRQRVLELHPEMATAIAEMERLNKEAGDSKRLEGLVGSLSQGSKEAKALATAIGDGMIAASIQAEGGIDGIAEKIIALRPESAAFVEKWRADIAEASKYGEGKFKDMLDQLRQGDTVSKKTAEAIKKHLVTAGQIVEKTFEEMIEPLRKIDPLLAEQAQKLHLIEKQGKGAFAGLGQMAKNELLQVTAGYLGVQEAIQLVTTSMKEQEAVRREIAGEMKSIAEVESTTRQNLKGFSDKDKDQILKVEIPRLMKETTFDDLKGAYSAAGDLGSSGASTVKELVDALKVAMQMNVATPGNAVTMAPALLDANRALGGKVSPEQSSTYMLEIARLARVTDPAKVFRNSTPAMMAAADSADPAHREDAALQGGALFAAFSRGGVDPTGDSSQTATMQFVLDIDKFFEGLGDSKAAEKAKQQIQELTNRDTLSEKERFTMDALIQRKQSKANVDTDIADTKFLIQQIDDNQRTGVGTAQSKREESFQKRDLKTKLSQLESISFKDFDEAKLNDLLSKVPGGDDYEAKLKKLQQVVVSGTVPNAAAFKALPTPEAQLKALQANPMLQKAFLADPKGEQRFRPTQKQLVTGGDSARFYETGIGVLLNARGNTKMFDDSVQEQLAASPALREATSQRRENIGKALQQSTDTTAANANFRETFNDTMRDTAFSLSDSMANTFSTALRLEGAAGPEEIVSGISIFKDKLDAFDKGGSAEEMPKATRLREAIDAAKSRLSSADIKDFSAEKLESASNIAVARTRDKFIATGGGNSVRVPASEQDKALFGEIARILQEQLAIQRNLLEANQGTQKNTRPMPPRTTDAQAAAAAVANARRRP